MASHVRTVILIGLVLLVAGGVRLYDLANHFTHVDDTMVAVEILNRKEDVDQMIERKRQAIYDPRDAQYSQLRTHAARMADQFGLLRFFAALSPADAIAKFSTYAPLQFLLTGVLIQPGQSYRQLLFLGRFPSFLFGFLALLALLRFYRLWYPHPEAALVALCLLALSWENIIYAEQMSCYAIGVWSALSLLLLLFSSKPTVKKSVLQGVCLGLLSATQYQILLFLPGWFAASLYYHWDRKNPRKGIAFLLVTGILVSVLFVPLYYLYLQKNANAGINWNAGPSGEYLFTFPTPYFFGKVIYLFRFFILNFPVAFQSVLAFIPESSRLFIPSFYFLMVLFFVGCYRLLVSRDHKHRAFSLFLFLSAIVYVLFILKGKLTLSPTRHSLIWLPYIAIVIAEGAGFVFRGRKFEHFSTLYAVLTLVLFLWWLPTIRWERRDKFDPEMLSSVMNKFGVKQWYGYDYTWNIFLMKKEIPYVTGKLYYTGDPFEPGKEVFAMVGHRGPLPAMLKPRFEVLFSEERPSETEIDFLPRTKNGTNGLFFYVLKKIPTNPKP